MVCAEKVTPQKNPLCAPISAARDKCRVPAKNRLRLNNPPRHSYAANRNRPAKSTMFSSVRSRLTIWYAAVLTCTLLFLSLVIYFIVKQSVLARTDAGLVELSDSFLATLEA